MMNLSVLDFILCILISCEESPVSLKSAIEAAESKQTQEQVKSLADLPTPEIPTILEKEVKNEHDNQ